MTTRPLLFVFSWNTSTAENGKNMRKFLIIKLTYTIFFQRMNCWKFQTLVKQSELDGEQWQVRMLSTTANTREPLQLHIFPQL